MRKTIKITAAAVLILMIFAFALPVSAAVFHDDVRVLISTGTEKTLNIRITGEYYIAEAPELSLPEGEASVKISGSNPIITFGDSSFTAASITLMSRSYGDVTGYVRVKNELYGVCAYLGNMRFDVLEGALRAINTLPIEQYLYGVVPYEMSNTFPVEALKAQAVCARGYVVANCSNFSSRDYDILDTSADQVYHGYVSKYTRAIAAVGETAGQVLTYGGDIIQAYYSASNGGQTELTGNVWQNDLPYYIHLDDIYDVLNPSSAEERSFVPDDFTPETTALMDPLVLTMMQNAADAAAGESVTLLSTVRIKAHSSKYPAPSRVYTKADVTLMTANSAGKVGQLTFTVSLDSLVYSEDNPDGIFNTTKPTLRIRGAEKGVLETDDKKQYEGWFFTNRRYGHGIGMSQRGAQQRATSLESYTDILAFYYYQTALCRVGGFEDTPLPSSSAYSVTAKRICGIKPGTTVAQLMTGLSSDAQLSYINSRGSVKAEGVACTGDYVRTVYGDGSSFNDIPIVIYGDTNGDGSTGSGDLDALKAHLSGTTALRGAQLTAADVNHDGFVDVLDALLLGKRIFNDYKIDQTDTEADT